ncbi:ZIP zinc/iron transporter [Paramyrothecium foliicola]|nr:ZIP zinc/iron transporter [Paramyrothecium foliicola]
MADVEADNCSGDAVDLSHQGLRIASIFIILVASLFGALMPVFLARQQKMHVPKLTFFICKYVGTGVIIATAWMHLLEPAADNLGDPCLEPQLGDYPWAFAIGLMTVMVMFFVEMLALRLSDDSDAHDHDHGSAFGSEGHPAKESKTSRLVGNAADGANSEQGYGSPVHRSASHSLPGRPDDVSYPPGGEDHFAHAHEHEEGDSYSTLASQLTAIFILEFGVVFHSVFIGLTLGTTDEVVILLIVLVFHQMFEGLGLGSRLATVPWPKSKQWMPYLLGLLFAISTPVGIAAGMGARPNNANTQKLVNGIFDAISSGILMYTGLVELLAHEFMFNPHMRKAPIKIILFAFACVAFGVAVMALLAKWA